MRSWCVPPFASFRRRSPSAGWRSRWGRGFRPGLEPVSLAVLALVLAGAASLAAQGARDEVGTPFITTYSHREYGAHPQNWAIAQDSRGVMYFGNSNGVLEFDGTAWRLIPVANGSIVRSLAVDREGILYVGAVGELGYLRPGEPGELVYESLVDELPAQDREFADVWRTFASDEGVFFWTLAKLMRWHQGRFRSWEIDSHQVPGVIGGRLCYNRRDAGLMVLEGDGFEPVPGGEELGRMRVDVMIPAGGDAMLLGTRGRLFTLSPPGAGGRRLARFATEADGYLATHRLYTALRLPDGGYLLTTMDGGVAVIGRGGELRHRFDRSNGLPDNSVWAASVDRQGNLWLGLNRGLVHVEIGSPVTVFSETSGLEGTVEAITRHDGELYVATSVGLFRLVGGRFASVPGVVGPCWSLLSYEPPAGGGRRLLVGTNPGIYEVGGDGVRLIRRAMNAFQLHRSSRTPSLVFTGEADGLGVLRFREGEWIDEGALEGIRDEIRSIAEDDAGRLWLGTHFEGVIRLTLDREAEIRVAELVRYGTEHGLPDLKGIKIYPVGDRLLFATGSGLWRFDPVTERFTPSPLLGPEFSDGGFGVLRLAPDRQENLWLSVLGQAPALASRRPDGSYTIDDVPFRRLPQGVWYALHPEPGGIAWLGGTEGLFRFDGALDINTESDFLTLVRRVSKADGTVLYGGSAGCGPRAPAAQTDAPLPYHENSLVFRFSATSFCNKNENEYRYLLEGYDRDWSPWTGETKKEYTNLSEGDYHFRVQGKNTYGTLGSEASYGFRVLPPWYRTAGFRSLLLLAVAGLLWAVLRAVVARTRRLQREASERERAVERERLIARLEEKNDELERFAYTVSHDLKAPLVTIRGFLGFLKRDAAAGEREQLERDVAQIEGAAAKMHLLLEELLELSRVGRQVSPPQEVPFGELVGEALELITGQLRERGVGVAVAPDLPAIFGDRTRLVEVLQNLLENAVKYMGDEQAPRIEVGMRDREPEPIFYVRDNGMGIEPRYHEQVFGLFERLETESEGTGVGLALVKRIVEVHGGRIWVESEGSGRGAAFCFTLAPSAPSHPR
ncbi:MAG: hypothetical protein GY856_41970 [bacterium]|nr:hypothetical protein [bacterium]